MGLVGGRGREIVDRLRGKESIKGWKRALHPFGWWKDSPNDG